MAFEASPALNIMPTEILDLIFDSLSLINLWHLRRTSKRFNAILHPHLLSTLRAMADPLPLALIRETKPVPLSFIYSLVLAVLGDDEGRKLWGRIFPSRNTSPETPYSSWLPATPPPPSSPSLSDQEPSPSAIRRQNEINAFPDLFIPHIRSSSPSLANLRRIHFWSILLWYKEWSFISSNPSPAEVDRARKNRLHWTYEQHRDNYESRPGDTPAIVDEFKRTYILRHHFDQPAPPRSDRDNAVLYMRSRRLLHSGVSLPERDYWIYGVTLRDRPTDYQAAFQMRRRPRDNDEYYEARGSVFASHADLERNG
ncbi:f-box domain-containing protein [Colletotrichum incanum]|uniref:F-box domain-containing protein n=1 Tax=Colletotrichum incanum TaxID=1573173 RepID=A0A166TIA4_COLIC|nr:f-box domain-containing protein [Colletotrichum incanum]OHW94502.1 F-box domain-containing protein [Colletotrichum incanum]